MSWPLLVRLVLVVCQVGTWYQKSLYNVWKTKHNFSISRKMQVLNKKVKSFQIICIKSTSSLKFGIPNQSAVKSFIKCWARPKSSNLRAGECLASTSQASNFLLNAPLTRMEIKWFYLVALCDFSNIIRPNRSNPDGETSLSGPHVPWWFQETATTKTGFIAFWRMCQTSSSIAINRCHLGIR